MPILVSEKKVPDFPKCAGGSLERRQNGCLLISCQRDDLSSKQQGLFEPASERPFYERCEFTDDSILDPDPSKDHAAFPFDSRRNALHAPCFLSTSSTKRRHTVSRGAARTASGECIENSAPGKMLAFTPMRGLARCG